MHWQQIICMQTYETVRQIGQGDPHTGAISIRDVRLVLSIELDHARNQLTMLWLYTIMPIGARLAYFYFCLFVCLFGNVEYFAVHICMTS